LRGYKNNEYSGVRQLEITLDAYSAESILALIAATVTEFDSLAQQFSPAYTPKKEPLLAFIKKIATNQLSSR
jgi:hypothetical protein